MSSDPLSPVVGGQGWGEGAIAQEAANFANKTSRNMVRDLAMP